MFIRLILAMLSALIITLSGYYFIYINVFEPLFRNRHPILPFLFLFLCTLTFIGFLLIRILPHVLRKFVEFIMFTWMGCMFIFFIVCIIFLPIHFYFLLTEKSQVTLSLWIFSTGLLVIFYALFQALRKPAIITTTVPLPSNISKQVENLVVIILSDIHVSGLIGYRKMNSLAQRVNALNPDFIFLTGDLMDGSLKQLRKEISPLKKLKAKIGIIYITGNHEYYSGPLNWKKHFKNEFQWEILSNSSKTFVYNGVTLNILGIEDKHWLMYEKIPKKQDQRLNTSVEHLRHERAALHNETPLEDCVNILLAHQPKDAKFLHTYPWINLQISGHTHGGQIWPLKYIVLKDQKYNAGLYKTKNNQSIYVNQGTGFWGPPMRLGTRGEITLMKFSVRV